MAEAFLNTNTQRYAVVTGANKGIGFNICKKLASQGIMVVLTARDKKKGIEAQERLKEFGFSDNVVFHQLDVVDPASIATLVDFIKCRFKRLDILVNNAGISGIGLEGDVSILQELIMESIASLGGGGEVNNAGISGIRLEGDVSILQELIVESIASLGDGGEMQPERGEPKASGTVNETLKGAEECLQTNYYGAKRITEALTPLLQLSDSPTIVNVSSILGNLKLLSNEWAKGVLSDEENLTEVKIDEVVQNFLKDLGEGSLKANNWPTQLSAYIVSKAALNAYTRFAAKQHPDFCINCVDPGFARTDITCNLGPLSAEEAAEGPVKLALVPNGGPSGLFFNQMEILPF